MALAFDELVRLYFVENPASSREMRLAFTVCKDAKLNPTIVSNDDLSDLTMSTSTVIVMEKFEGTSFERLSLKDSLCRVIGPKAIVHCVKNVKSIPANDSPVYNLAMEGLVVTTSKLLNDSKEETARLIGWMGGSYSPQLTRAVTHVISDDCRSGKCESALGMGLSLYKSNWVRAVWEASQTQDVHASDEAFNKFRTPPFEGMRITCSNFPAATKIRLQNLIEQNGGVYMKTLEHNQTTILVINVPEGAKFTHAQQWGIPCVKDSWVYESVKKGMAVHSEEHLLKAPPRCSTPTSELPSFMSNSEISVIPNASNASAIDETCSAASSAFTYKPNRVSPGRDIETLLKDINLAEASSAGLFLDGCKIYLSGFNVQEVEKLKKVAIKGGATIFTEINDRLTHVLVSRYNSTSKEMQQIERLSNKPDIVKLSWLVDSIKMKCTAPVNLHLCIEKEVSSAQNNPPASPLSHKGLNLLTNNKFGSPNPSRPLNRKLFVKAPKEVLTPDKPETSRIVRTPRERNVEASPAPSRLNNESITTDTTSSDSTTIREQFFKGLVFQLVDIANSESCNSTIYDLGGRVEPLTFQGVVDYVVVPIQGSSKKFSATEVVTTLWVEDCYEKGSLLPVEYFHVPFPSNPIKTLPLKDSVLTLSGFTDKERAFLSFCGLHLGARMQDAFSKRDNPAKGVFKSSHLICKTPTGSKFSAAKKWDIPALSEKWILACLSSNSTAPIDSYRMDDQDGTLISVSKRDDITTPGVLAPTPAQAPSRPAIAAASPKPANSPAVDGDNFATPINYKRKISSIGSMGKSPFHVSTPDTPYGRIFLDDGEEPSPSTRKRWKRFIDQFPDESTPEFVEFRQRRPSTPMDVIKKQLWVKFGGIQIEGIEPETGELLPDGPFAQWAGNISNSSNSSYVTNANGETSGAAQTPKNRSDLEFQLSYYSNQLDNILTPGGSEKDKTGSVTDGLPVEERPNSGPEQDNEVKWIDRNNTGRRTSNPPEVWNFGQPLPARQNEPADTDDTQSTPKLLEDGDVEDTEPTRIFVLSSATSHQKTMMEGIITSLGGVISCETNYDPKSTHLLIEKLARSEKLLCSIASGKWVLHTSYITECYQARCFLPEEDFEWGNERAQSRLPRFARGTIEADLARAAHSWRVKSVQLGRSGAFNHIRAVILAPENKMAQYSRLLLAGRGVLLTKEKIADATHVFWDQGKIDLPFTDTELKHILLIKPVYLGDFLTKYPDPDIKKYTIQ